MYTGQNINCEYDAYFVRIWLNTKENSYSFCMQVPLNDRWLAQTYGTWIKIDFVCTLSW